MTRRTLGGIDRFHRGQTRRGFTLAEVIFVIVLVFLAIVLIILMLPRSRETARLNGCARSLGQIGQALAQHESGMQRYPGVDLAGAPGSSPQAALLRMSSLRREGAPAKAGAERQPGAVPQALPPLVVADLICPSDTGPALPSFPAPTNYRANTGSTPRGENGPFAPGASVSLADLITGDGADYTVAFAERLVGSGGDGQAGPRDYALVNLPFTMAADGYPTAPADSHKGDAGSDTALPRWNQTLYTHALPPQVPRSVIARDGSQAYMGVSSGHAGGIQALLAGGSVRLFTRAVDARIWAQFGSYQDSAGVQAMPDAAQSAEEAQGVASPKDVPPAEPEGEPLKAGPRGRAWDPDGANGSVRPR